MASESENTTPPTDSTHHKTSSSDLFSSAKFLAGAAKSAYGGAAFDKSKAAEAGEDLLGAASDYGKLKERGYGSYVEKAEGYLHQFHSSESHHDDQIKPPSHDHKSTPDDKSTDQVDESTPTQDHHKSTGGFGGFGDYVNIAEGFFKK